jgi:hypothetical protein
MSVYGLSDQDVADLRIFYEDTRKDSSFKDNPFLAMVQKEEHDGQQVAQTVKYGYTGAHGPDFATNYANLSASMQKKAQFFFPWIEGSALDQIGAKEDVLSRTKKGANVNLVADALEGSQRVCAQDIEYACFGSGGGALGTISSNTNPSGTTYILTLTRVGDSERIGVGDFLVTATAELAASNDTGRARVTGVDRDLGTVTVTALSSWTPTNGRLIFHEAARASASGLTNPQWFVGLAGWIPLAAPGSSDSFGTVNRSVDVAALAGRRTDGRKKPIKKAIRELLSHISNAKEARPDVVWVHPYTFDLLQEDPEAQKTYDNKLGEGTGSAAGLYFPGMIVHGPKGPARVHASWAMHQDRLFACTMKTLHLHRPPAAPEGIVMMGGKDGDGLIDLIATNGKQVRSWWLSMLTCDFPGANGVAQLA